MAETTEHSQQLLETSEKVRELFLSVAKLISAKTIYAANNPTLTSFTRAFAESFHAFFEVEKELVLTVEQYRLRWHDHVVYENEDRNGSIAFMFFKDGVGEVTIHSSVTATELEQFVDIIKDEIHNPTPDSDIVTRLWKADFANISYRVLDEDPMGEPDGERGGGARNRAKALEADDHAGAPGDASGHSSLTDGEGFASIADYLLGVVTASRPKATAVEKELFVQDTFETLFYASTEELRRFNEELADTERSDKIATLLEIAIDFATGEVEPSTLENAICLAQRAVGFSKEERNPRTLARLLTLIRRGAEDCTNADVVTSLRRLERDLVAPEFLRALGERVDAPTEEVLGIVNYCRQVGETTVPVLRQMLKAHQKPVVHREVCDALLSVAGRGIDKVVEALDVDDPLVARDVIYLLRRSKPRVLPQVVRELVHYPDVQVREGTLQLLVDGGYEDGPTRAAILLEDQDAGIRRHALAALVKRPTTAVVRKVMSLCFDEKAPERDDEERTRLFEAAGRLAPDDMVERLSQALKKRTWHHFGRQQARSGDKLLAIAALVQTGEKGRPLLNELARDSDADVRAAAELAVAALSGSSGGEGDA